MPKYSREMEDKIIALFEQGKRNSVISRELSIYRGALPSRRKEWVKLKQEQEKSETEKDLKQKPDHKKPGTEQEKIIQQEKTDSHPLDQQIYTLIRYQGTHSREEALSQAIETQHSFNPYILNHGLKTPKELVKFFEDEIRLERDHVNDLEVDSNINRSLFVTCRETIANLKELAEERYEEGYQDGKKDHSLLVPCVMCGEPCTLVPGTESHRLIIEILREQNIAHTDCLPKYERVFMP